jgi:hypothetical protein
MRFVCLLLSALALWIPGNVARREPDRQAADRHAYVDDMRTRRTVARWCAESTSAENRSAFRKHCVETGQPELWKAYNRGNR